jgi:putative aminopeptidase FrvX
MNKLFNEILNIQTYTHKTEKMTEYIVNKAIEIGCYVYVDEGNVYAIKGDSETYPCIVAHTDSVHDIINGYKVISNNKIAMAYDTIKNKPTGIGGDDKVGIYIALQCLQDLHTCKAVFFRDEEIGCEGSSYADMDFFNDCRFVLQCDRKGNKDFVNNIMGTELFDSKFSNAIAPILKKHGYSETSGGMTDVYQLKSDGLKIAVANMSCGYYNPHTDGEIINFADVRNCLSMVKDIMRIKNTFKHTPIKRSYWSYDKGYSKGYDKTYSKGNDIGYWDDWDYSWGKTSKRDKDAEYKDMIKLYDECWECRQFIPKTEMADFGLCKICTRVHAPF